MDMGLGPKAHLLTLGELSVGKGWETMDNFTQC